MHKDRVAINEILQEMIKNGDQATFSMPAGRALNRLEDIVEAARAEAIGWAQTDIFVQLDKDEDPRKMDIPASLERAKRDLNTV